MDPLDYKESITKIYLVRHGETLANKKGLIFGQLDLDLNSTGVKQATKAAHELFIKAGVRAGLKPAPTRCIDYILTSPLKRAKHTASIIAKKLRVKDIIIEKNLIEKSEGSWDGKSYWEIREKDPKNYSKWVQNPFKSKAPKGESIYDLNKRVKQFHQTILKKYLGKNIIIVSHSGPIRLFILNLLGANINKFWNLQIGCGGVVEISLSRKHSVIKI